MHCKNWKKYPGNPFPKKLISISKTKIKGKSKCTIWLTKKSFIHEIQDKYGLESKLEIPLQFLFTDVLKEHRDLFREL